MQKPLQIKDGCVNLDTYDQKPTCYTDDILYKVLHEQHTDVLSAEGLTIDIKRFKDVRVGDTLYSVNVDNLLFSECALDESYITECHFKNIEFDKCSLNKVTILRLEHIGFNLSNSSIEDINIDIASLKGISVNMIEAAMLARYLGIIIKD